MWGGVFGTSVTIDLKEQLVAIQLTQGGTARLQSRLLFKNLIYGAIIEQQRALKRKLSRISFWRIR